MKIKINHFILFAFLSVTMFTTTSITGFAQSHRQNGWSAEISGGLSAKKTVSDRNNFELLLDKHCDFNFRAAAGYKFMITGGLFVKPMLSMSYNKTYFPSKVGAYNGILTYSFKDYKSYNNHYYSFRMGIDATIGYNFFFNANTSLDVFGGLIYSYNIAENNKSYMGLEKKTDKIDLFKNNFSGELGLALNYKKFYYKFFVEFPFTYYYQYNLIYDGLKDTFKERNTCSFNLGIGYNF